MNKQWWFKFGIGFFIGFFASCIFVRCAKSSDLYFNLYQNKLTESKVITYCYDGYAWLEKSMTVYGDNQVAQQKSFEPILKDDGSHAPCYKEESENEEDSGSSSPGNFSYALK